MIKVAIVGATGYAGEELIKILLRHDDVIITSLTAKIDKEMPISLIFPSLAGQIDMVCKNLDIDEVAKKAEFIFLALPHKVSMEVVPSFIKKGKKVVDLSADYRLKDLNIYKKWYGVEHKDKANVLKAVYGMPELYQKEIKKTNLIANPGCYPTGIILAISPLLKESLIDADDIIIDAKSGVSGAGRNALLSLHFCEVNENLKAYKINTHQHKPEIEQILSSVAAKDIHVVFVPHLVPMNRGILSTIYLKTKKKIDTKRAINIYKKFYKDAPFIRILNEGLFPQIKDVVKTNFCDIGIKVENDLAIVVAAIDNLVKGASGQAVQNMNVMCEFSQTKGLL